jgi:biopolymer transport protein TolQ
MGETVMLSMAAVSPAIQADVLRLVANSGGVVKAVLLVLLAFSVLSWAVIISRFRALRRAELQSEAFLDDLRKERRLSDLRDRAGRYAESPLVPIFLDAFHELTSAVSEGIVAHRGTVAPEAEGLRVLGRVRRRLEESGAAQADRVDKNLGILATTGSVTPFIGLFGTVWGIMNAFQGIGITGSATLGAVAPGISEALVTTAAGLAAAIPAVIAYNLLLARARRLGGRIERFVLTFASIAETQIESGRAPAAHVEAGKVRL